MKEDVTTANIPNPADTAMGPKLKVMLIVLAVLGSVGAGAFWYYKDTQQRIQTLQENNAKLEVALQTSEESINALQADMAKFSELNNKLSIALQNEWCISKIMA